MNWAEITARRAVPGAGVFIAITRRCPLHCAHCSTESTMSSPQAEDDYYRQFVASFTPDNHPEVVWFTGGEPMLRHRLVRELAASCRKLSATTALTTGLYFGRRGKIPAHFWPALEEIDFITVSIDTWHEQEVNRQISFSCFEQMLSRGLHVGVQATGRDSDDPYLLDLLDEIEARFGHQIGVFVSLLKPAGRGVNLMEPWNLSEDAMATGRPRPQGCGGLSWPVFGFGEQVVNACCNQEAVNDRPEHLSLPVDWPHISRSLREDPVLRVINVLGPRVLAYNLDATTEPMLDYCGKCRSLAGRSGLAETAQEIVDRPSWGVFEDFSTSLRQKLGDPTLGQKKFAEHSKRGG